MKYYMNRFIYVKGYVNAYKIIYNGLEDKMYSGTLQ